MKKQTLPYAFLPIVGMLVSFSNASDAANIDAALLPDRGNGIEVRARLTGEFNSGDGDAKESSCCGKREPPVSLANTEK